MTSFEPQRRPQSRKRKSLLPIILILGFVFWLSKRNEKDKFGVTLRTTSSTEILAKQRDAYPEGPEGTVARLEDSLGQAEATLTTLQSERRVLERQVADTDALLGEFKTAYLSAKNGSPWPVPVRGRSYSEAQLTSKVQSLLEIREQLGNQQTIKDQHVAQAQTIIDGISTKLDGMRAELARQETKRELEKLKQLSEEADQYVDQKVEEAPSVNTGPVRTLDELIEASEGAQATPSNQKALEFLKVGG